MNIIKLNIGCPSIKWCVILTDVQLFKSYPKVHNNVLIGMGAIVMDDCVIEEGCIVAAGAVVTANTHMKAGSLYAGVPAKFIKEVGVNLREGEIERIANNYLKYSGWFK